MKKGSTHQQDIIIINKYAHNIIAPKYMKQTPTELKGEITVHNNSKGFQYSTFNNGQNIQTEDQKEKIII